MHANMVCKHRSPVVVNPVEGGGWRGHCLRCGQLGPVGSDSVEARARLQSSQSSELPEEARVWMRSGARLLLPGRSGGG
jgi:hypothetical protein